MCVCEGDVFGECVGITVECVHVCGGCVGLESDVHLVFTRGYVAGVSGELCGVECVWGLVGCLCVTKVVYVLSVALCLCKSLCSLCVLASMDTSVVCVPSTHCVRVAACLCGTSVVWVMCLCGVWFWARGVRGRLMCSL